MMENNSRHPELDSGSSRSIKGFTLIELLVVVIIIAVLAAVAMPMYQHAVLKSRFSKLMPAAKSLAAANEVYYLNNGIYSDNPASLDVGSDTDQLANGTHILLNDDDTVSFVRLSNDEVPHARYVMYQQHSANFANTTMCEAESEDEKATWLCEKGLNGVLVEGGNSGNESGWVAYLLTGSVGTEDHFAAGGNGGQEDEPGGEPQPLQCEGEQPATINASTGAIGTATCVNGRWMYSWTGGAIRSAPNARCYGNSRYYCADIFSGQNSYCEGGWTNGCSGARFIGAGTFCNAQTQYACADAVFRGDKSYCSGQSANACSGAIIQAGAYCDPYYSSSSGCDGALYGAHPDKDSNLIGSCYDRGGHCPNGVPLRGSWNSTTRSYDISGWKGDCCNPAYMVSGECPSGIAVCQ